MSSLLWRFEISVLTMPRDLDFNLSDPVLDWRRGSVCPHCRDGNRQDLPPWEVKHGLLLLLQVSITGDHQGQGSLVRQCMHVVY